MRAPDRVILVALLVVAAALRIVALDREDLWLDEAASVRLAGDPPAVMMESLTRDNKPPLYYLALHAWLGLFGDGLVALRSLSAVAGVAAIVVVWFLGVPFVSSPAARVSAVVLALHPLAIHYSREGRNYSLLLLLTTVTILAAPRAIEAGRARWWIVHAVALGAATMTHYLGALLIPVTALQALLSGRRDAWKAWSLSTCAALVPVAIWSPWVSRQREIVASSLAWFLPIWEAWGPLEPLRLSLVMLTPGGSAPRWVGLPVHSAVQPLVWATLLFAAVGFAFALRRAAEPGSRLAILGTVFIPLCALLALSHLTFPAYLVGRADLIALPGFVLFLGCAIAEPRTRLVSLSVGVLVGALCAIGLVTYFATQPRNPESRALRALASSLRSGDLVVCTGLTRPTAEYAIRRSGHDVHFASYPEEMASHPAIYDRRAWPAERLAAEIDVVDDAIRETLRRRRRAVVLLVEDPAGTRLGAKLDPLYSSRILDVYELKREGSRVRVVEAVSRVEP